SVSTRTRWTGRSASSRTTPSIFVPPRSTPSARIAAPLATAPASGREDGSGGRHAVCRGPHLSRRRLARDGDPRLARPLRRPGGPRAHNRAMVEFCSVDRRLLATGYVPLGDFERARAMAEEAIAMGSKALLVPSACPARHSPSHVGLFPVWEIAQEARIPIVLHVGGGGQLLDPHYFVNGLPPVPDFHGGAENFRSVDYMAIPFPPMQTLSTLIIDGILDRFPRLRIGVIEQGAVWVPSWMRQLDTTVDAFSKNEERLRRLQLRPSEYVRRQIRVTPYPHEP